MRPCSSLSARQLWGTPSWLTIDDSLGVFFAALTGLLVSTRGAGEGADGEGRFSAVTSGTAGLREEDDDDEGGSECALLTALGAAAAGLAVIDAEDDVPLRSRVKIPEGARSGRKPVVELEREGDDGGGAGRGAFTDPALSKLSSSNLLRISM
jgi:hypothetical protein